MKKNTLWISSTPRTGSMWLLNVVREILKISQFRVYPIKIPHTDTENFEIYKKESLKDKTNFNKYVFKVHTILKSDLPRSKILTTIRDPRDVCVSFKEFMKSDFKSALDATKNIIRYVKIYKTFNKNYLKFFKYEAFKRDEDNWELETLDLEYNDKV